MCDRDRTLVMFSMLLCVFTRKCIEPLTSDLWRRSSDGFHKLMLAISRLNVLMFLIGAEGLSV